MKWHFNRLRLFFIGVLTLLLSACATVGPGDEPVAKAEETQSQNVDAGGTATDTATASSLAALPNIPDPMQVDLPLDLIKAYDEAKNLLAAKNKAGAITKLQQAQTAFPNKSGPSYRLARIYLEQKQYDQALAAVNNSVNINPKNYYAQNLKGVVLRELGKFSEAKDAYLAAVAAYPRHAQSHLNLGILADIYMYDLPLALKHYEFYLLLIQAEDKKVNGWVIDLKRRIPAGN